MGGDKMKQTISYINHEQFSDAYEIIMNRLTINEFNIEDYDFLYECDSIKAYKFILYCIEKSKNVLFEFVLSVFLTYGNYVECDYKKIIRKSIMHVLNTFPNFYPAIEFVVYTFYEHPDAPFSKEEIVTLANKYYYECGDSLSKKILRDEKLI